MIRALLLSRARIARRDWLGVPGKPGWARHPALALGLAAGLAALVYSGMSHAFAALASNAAAAGAAHGAAGAGAEVRAGLLALALSGSLVALLAFDVDDVVRSLLLDPDLELLRRAPLGGTALLAIKAFDAAPRTVLPLLVLAAPAVAAFLAGSAAPLAGAVVAVAALGALWLTTLAIGVALSLVLLRFVPAARAREALGLVSTLVLTLVWIAGALVLPRALVLDPAAANALQSTLAAAIRGAGPAAAAARGISAAAAGAGGGAAAELAWVAGFALFAVLAAWIASRSALATVLERMSGAEAAGFPSAARAPALGWKSRPVASAIVRRDARMLGRSWTLLGDLLVASVLWSLLPLAGFAAGELDWGMLVRLMLLTVTIGLGYEVAARSIPFERQAGFWVRVAPVRGIQYCAAKLMGSTLVAGPIVVLVGASFVLVRPVALHAVSETAPLLLAALLLSQATGLWAGARFGDPAWVNPRAMLRFTGRVVASVLVLVQLAGWLAAFYYLDIVEPGARTILVPALVAAALAIATLPIGATAKRLQTLEWPN